MTDAAQAPVKLIHEMSSAFIRAQALYVIAKLGIADIIGDDQASIVEIANAAGAHEDALYRVMRALAGFGVLREEEHKVFSLKEAGRLLKSDHPRSLRHAVIFRCEENYDAFRELLNSVRTGEIAFERRFGVPRFQYLKSNKAATKSFQDGMRAVTRGEYPAILAEYDFSDSKTIVDVGGGDGALLLAILSMHPHLLGVLLDEKEAIDLARSGAAGSSDRCHLVAGDFFKEVPSGGDTYILKSVLHDWPDGPAVNILQRCRHAMKSNSKLLVIERVIGPPNQESYALLVDLTVLVEHGGKVRGREQFEILFDRAGLNIGRVIDTDSSYTIIELTKQLTAP